MTRSDRRLAVGVVVVLAAVGIGLTGFTLVSLADFWSHAHQGGFWVLHLEDALLMALGPVLLLAAGLGVVALRARS